MRTEVVSLIVFNTTLKYNAESSSPRLEELVKQVDRDDRDEITQLLFAEGRSFHNTGGELDMNFVLKQMGLAKGLMGFLSIIDDGPSEEEDDQFQFIRSRKTTTVIYNSEKDFQVVAVFSNERVNKKPSTHAFDRTSLAEPLRDEECQAILTRATDQFQLLHGRMCAKLENDGRDDLSDVLQSYWTDWLKEDHREEHKSVDITAMTMQDCIEWKRLVELTNSSTCLLMNANRCLAAHGDLHGDAILLDFLYRELYELQPKTSKKSELDSIPSTSSYKELQEQSSSSSWKKLGFGSLMGMGSNTPSGAPTPVAGEPSSNTTRNTTSGPSIWGLGQWFGSSSEQPPSTSKDKATEHVARVSRTKTPDADISSLQAALSSDRQQEAPSRLELNWTRRKLWLEGGLSEHTISWTTYRNVLFAVVDLAEDAAIYSVSNESAELGAILKGAFRGVMTNPKQSQPPDLSQFSKAELSEDLDIVYHNPLQLEIRQTPNAGRGVFAPRDLPAGIVLEESPVLLLTQDEWESGKLNDGILGGYAFTWRNGGMGIGLGIASMFNHSPKPNVNFIRRVPTSKQPHIQPGLAFLTCRPIKEGEELFIRYGEENKLWFSPDYEADEPAQGSRSEPSVEEDTPEAFLQTFGDMSESDAEEAVPTSLSAAPVAEASTEDPPVSFNAETNRRAAPVVVDDLEEDISVDSIPADVPVLDEATRLRKEAKKALADAKTAKYQQKQAARTAASIITPSVEQPKPDTFIHDNPSLSPEDYANALRRLDLTEPLSVSGPDLNTIMAEEEGQTLYEGMYGFAGWRKVKREPGLIQGGEQALDDRMEVWAAETTPQMIGKFTKYVRERNLLDDDLSHLKRINKDPAQGLTLFALYNASHCTADYIQHDLVAFDASLNDITLRKCTVPARAAYSMKEVEILRQLWPVALRQRPVIAADLPWSTHRKAWVNNGIKRVVELAKANKKKGELQVAVYAASPPREAMLDEPDAIPPTPDIRAAACDTRKEAGHPLRHAVLNCVRDIANLRTVSPFADVQATRNGAGYLLTSLSVFLSHEPCVMCAMALVHSRVKEVFYIVPGRQAGGGFGGSFPVHSHPGLNHQMDLFDCSALVSEEDKRILELPQDIDV